MRLDSCMPRWKETSMFTCDQVTVKMGESGDGDDDWFVECSDDEKYNSTGADKNAWEPKPKDIKELYIRLSSGDTLELDWKCPGRRSPTPERQEEDMDIMKEEEQPKEEEKLAPTEFDFDESAFDANPITPRRTPGSAKTPRSQQKRVARLDKIMDDIRRHKKLNKESSSLADPGKRDSVFEPGTPQRPHAGSMSTKRLGSSSPKGFSHGLTSGSSTSPKQMGPDTAVSPKRQTHTNPNSPKR